MLLRLHLFFFLLSACTSSAFSQLRIAFWNVENLFDTNNDSLTRDDEFTPTGLKHWTYTRYQRKLLDLSKVIVALGEWNGIAVLGLSEIENKKVIKALLYTTPLAKDSLKYIHRDSPDRRGIDVALVYNPRLFYPISTNWYPIRTRHDSFLISREILHVTGHFHESPQDTFELFINHWPSKFGGHKATESKRMAAALTLKTVIDSIQQATEQRYIIAMGDFNDEWREKSLIEGLEASATTPPFKTLSLYNLTSNLSPNRGTHKHAGHWSYIDHMICNGTLILVEENQYYVTRSNLFTSPFLMCEDLTHTGKKMNRTYIGPKYVGGISDHLPIYLDLHRKKQQSQQHDIIR